MFKKIFGISKKKKEDEETKGTTSGPSSPQKSKDPNTSFGSSPSKRVKHSSTTNRFSTSSPKKSKDTITSNSTSTTDKKAAKELPAPIAVHEDPLSMSSNAKRNPSGVVTPCSPTILKKSGECQVAGQVSNTTFSSRHSTKSPLPDAQGSTNGATTRGPQLSGSPNSLLESSGGMNVWRLPWQQPRVVTCQYCNRPRRAQHHTLVSKEKKCDSDSEDAESYLSSTSTEDSDECVGAGITYCKCRHSPRSEELADAHEPVVPVFIVETSRCHSMPGFLPLALNPDAEENEDINDGPTKLSLVSPLTSHSLRRSKTGRLSAGQSGGGAAAAAARGNQSAFEDAEERQPKDISHSISAWLENQELQTSGKPVAAEK